MDSIRTKRSNKKPWIIGGSIAGAVLIIIIILCVTLGSSAEESAGTTVKDVFEAFTYVETTLTKTYEKEDGIKGPLVTDVRKLTEKVRMVEKLYQGKLEAEKNGQKYDIKIIEDKLANARFVEKDGKIEVVFEDKSEEAKEKTPSTDGKTDGAEAAATPKSPEAPATAPTPTTPTPATPATEGAAPPAASPAPKGDQETGPKSSPEPEKDPKKPAAGKTLDGSESHPEEEKDHEQAHLKGGQPKTE